MDLHTIFKDSLSGYGLRTCHEALGADQIVKLVLETEKEIEGW